MSVWQMDPMGRHLRPRSEFRRRLPRFQPRRLRARLQLVHDPADDKPGLDSGVEAELRHVIHESLNALVHYATVPFLANRYEPRVLLDDDEVVVIEFLRPGLLLALQFTQVVAGRVQSRQAKQRRGPSD